MTWCSLIWTSRCIRLQCQRVISKFQAEVHSFHQTRYLTKWSNVHSARGGSGSDAGEEAKNGRMSALSFGCFSHFQPFPDFALPYSFFFFTFVSKLNLNQEHHKKHKSSAQQPTMAQEEAQQKLYNNAQAQSPNKSLLWALFMKQNLRFGLVGQFRVLNFFKVTVSLDYNSKLVQICML